MLTRLSIHRSSGYPGTYLHGFGSKSCGEGSTSPHLETSDSNSPPLTRASDLYLLRSTGGVLINDNLSEYSESSQLAHGP